jgi:hypothetical protein
MAISRCIADVFLSGSSGGFYNKEYINNTGTSLEKQSAFEKQKNLNKERKISDLQ